MSIQAQRSEWRIVAHPLFLDQLESLINAVEKLRQQHPVEYQRKNNTKRLYAILKLILDDIPQDPTRPAYRQGNTLGKQHRHWRRAKFFQQYRLFFRYNVQQKIIILGWVNDEKTKRAYGSKTDAYRTFGQMLKRGTPPDDWETLLAEAQAESERFKGLLPPMPNP